MLCLTVRMRLRYRRGERPPRSTRPERDRSRDPGHARPSRRSSQPEACARGRFVSVRVHRDRRVLRAGQLPNVKKQIGLPPRWSNQNTNPNHANPATVALPPYYPGTPVVREDWAGYLDSVSGLDVTIDRVIRRLGGRRPRRRHDRSSVTTAASKVKSALSRTSAARMSGGTARRPIQRPSPGS
jgi:hypothetical protein